MLNKAAIHTVCLSVLEERLQLIREEMLSLQASAEEETKSSAGDKYETAREMIQSEKEKLSSRLEETTKFLHIVRAIRADDVSTQVKAGSLVETDAGWMYLAIGLGAIKVMDTNVFVVSPVSPIGQAILDKKAEDEYQLNGKVHLIKQVL